MPGPEPFILPLPRPTARQDEIDFFRSMMIGITHMVCEQGSYHLAAHSRWDRRSSRTPVHDCPVCGSCLQYAGLHYTGIGAAVDQEILAGNVARMRRAEEGTGLAEFTGIADAFRRDRCLFLGPDLVDPHTLRLRRLG